MEQSVIRHNRSNQDHFEVTRDIYHPQTKFAKVMFSHLSVCHSVHRGVCLSACCYTPPGAQPPRPGTPLGPAPPQDQAPPTRHPREQAPPPPAQCILRDMVNKWEERILLECNHVVVKHQQPRLSGVTRDNQR